jgi:RimJ/RimL family protein N-acetyltransferase
MIKAADTIYTERLRLDRMTEDDAGLALAIWNDPAFIRHVTDRGIRTLDEARDAMREGMLKLWAEHGYGPYRISLRDEEEAMGLCGLFKRENLEDPDIGYSMLPDFCGKGYATEAARAVAAHARDHMNLARIIAIVSPDNPRSIRLLEKLGMSPEGTVRMPDEDEDILLYGLSLH